MPQNIAEIDKGSCFFIAHYTLLIHIMLMQTHQRRNLINCEIDHKHIGYKRNIPDCNNSLFRILK